MVGWLFLLVIPEQPHHLGHSKAQGFAGFPNVLQVQEKNVESHL